MISLKELAEHLHGQWFGNPDHRLAGVSSFQRATEKDVVYYDNIILKNQLHSSKAGAVLITAEHLIDCPVNAIVVGNPHQAMTECARLLCPPKRKKPGIEESAEVSKSATLGEGIYISFNATVEQNVILEDNVILGANSFIGQNTKIGHGSIIGNNVSIAEGCYIGKNVVIDDGVIIGAAPFNFSKLKGHWQSGPDVGAVVIGDKVHIGANTVIDRGSLSDTFISEGTCIDNLVQIAHDVIIGPNTAIAGCSAIGAYTQIGADCILGGACSLAANISLANDIVITGMSTVSKSLCKPGIYSSGTMVSEHKRWRRNVARFRRLDDYILRLNSLEKKKQEKTND